MSDFGKWSAYLYALTRVVVARLFLCHGLSKLVHVPVPAPGGMLPFMVYAAGSFGLTRGLLVGRGFFTRWAALIDSGGTAADYFMVHLPRGLYPIGNGGELAVLYSFTFLFIAACGAGGWSVDRLGRKGLR